MGGNINALAALYQAEKTDATGVFNTAMALMGIGGAYLGLMMTNVDKFGVGLLNWLTVLLLPCPLWLIAAFHSLMTLNAMSHGVSVRIIENQLFKESGLHVDRDLVGSASGDKFMDITKSRYIHKVTTSVVYFGVAALVVGFTIYVLFSAWGHVSHAALIVAIVSYIILSIIVMFSWIVGMAMIKDADDRSNIELKSEHSIEDAKLQWSRESTIAEDRL